jgi:hypothetical protein
VNHVGVSGTIAMDADTRRAEKEVALVMVAGGDMTLVDARYPATVPEP